MYKVIIALFLLIFTANPALSHDLQYEVSDSQSVVIKFFFGDNMAFSYESYEIYAPNESIPFQTGRTDKLGRISLLPDREGVWRIKIFSESGHGQIGRAHV